MITNLWKKTKATFTRLNATARILTPLLLALATPYQLEAAGPAPVNLLSTANFVILSGAGITTTGGGIINGNIGASPIAGSVIGVPCAQVNGTIYAVDASGPPCAVVDPSLLTTAKNDLTTAYNDAAGRTTPTATNPGGGNLGGLSLAPGLYKITTTTLITGSDLTLAGGANDVWIFQCAQDLQLGSGIKVILTGGAQANNIFWQVGTSAVLGTFSVFNGTILASQAITMDTSSTMNGRALAFTAGVVFNGNGAALPGSTGTNGLPGIAVQQPPGTNLVNGAVSINFGSVAVGASTNQIFTITNIGGANLTGLGITIDGANSAMFSVTANPIAPVSPGGGTTFTARFAPASTGVKTAALHITDNDLNNNPFNIAITGTGADGAIIPSTNVFVNVNSAGISPIMLDPQTGLFTNSVLLTNNSPNTVVAIRLLILNLPADVQVYYASGMTTNGTPYVQYNFPLAPGAIVDFTMDYYRASRLPFSTPTYVPEDTTAVTLIIPINSAGIMATNYVASSGLIGFYTTPGRSYGVQFSTNMITWLTASPFIIAPANYVQWVDSGPPKTETLGLTRFYRVFELP